MQRGRRSKVFRISSLTVPLVYRVRPYAVRPFRTAERDSVDRLNILNLEVRTVYITFHLIARDDVFALLANAAPQDFRQSKFAYEFLLLMGKRSNSNVTLAG